MDKKLIQEQRIKKYFLTAAREIIRAEGIEAVSSRNVADRAGYSYATLYNYFNDIRDLIFNCIEDFMEECREFINEGIIGMKPGKERLWIISKKYSDFFIQYPGIFDLFFQHKTGELSSGTAEIEKLYSLFDTITKEDWNTIKENNKELSPSIPSMRHKHKLHLHGLLLFYLNRRCDLTYEDFQEELKSLMDIDAA